MESKFYTDLKTQKNPCLKINISKRIQSIIDSICKSYLFAQAKKPKLRGVLENRCNVGILKQPGHTKIVFLMTMNTEIHYCKGVKY